MIRLLKPAALIALTILPGTLAHAQATFQSLVCRSHDYFELGGDRKTLEVSVTKQSSGQYRLAVSRTFDVLQPNHEYRERDRALETEMTNLNCVQAPHSVDLKVITCTGANLKTYFNLSRLERTLIMSELSSQPGMVIKTVNYEAHIYGRDQREYAFVGAEECALRP